MVSYGLFLDIQASQGSESAQRGIGRFVVDHARALVARSGLVRGLALSPLLPFPGGLPAELLTSPLLSWSTATAFRRVEQEGPFAYHIMSPFEWGIPWDSILPPHAIRPHIPLIVTLYDLIPLVRADEYLRDRSMAARYAARLEVVRHADLVLAISEHTRREAIQLLDLNPDRVVHIGAGVSPTFRPPLPGTDPGMYVRQHLSQIVRPFILYVSGAVDRKNTEALITAFAKLTPATRAAHQLVITCSLPPEFEAKWRSHARTVGLRDDELILTDYVSDQLLLALYQTAVLSVFPSLQEGFGLPVVEASACGCPALCSNTSSLPEILDWAASTFDPTNAGAISNVIEQALTDHGFLKQLREIGLERAQLHTWEAVAERTATALQRLPPPVRTTRRSSARKARIALVGPFPPTRSGIGDYNGRLAVELAHRCELDLFSEDGSGNDYGSEISGRRHLPTSSLGVNCNPGGYDAIVYTVGNSEHHLGAYAAAKRCPGIVWFHDVRYGGFFYSLGAARNPADPHALINEKLLEHYGPRVPSAVLGAFSNDYEARFGLRLTAEWVRGARAVITHSRFAEHMLRLDQGPNARLPPMVNIPWAIPSLVNVDHVVRDEPPIIATFGFVSPIKFPEKLIEALGQVRAVAPARLVFVGPVDLQFRHYLASHAAKLGLAEHVEFTGDVPEPEYQRWLWRATCAAQVRNPTNGEISSAVADCIGAGLPVVTNILGVAEGYVPDAVVEVAPYFSVEELAARLIELITEPNVWERHHTAAKQQAPRWTFENVADELLRLVARLAGD